MVVFDEPLTINPMEVMRDESTWTSILRPDEVPIPYTSFTTAETAVSHDPNFDYKTPSFQHLSNVLNCSGFQLTESEQTYLLSAIEGTKPAPRYTPSRFNNRPPSASASSPSSSYPTSVLSGRIYKPQLHTTTTTTTTTKPRRPSRPISLREPHTPSDEDAHNPFASLAPVHHSLGPKEIPRFYGMRMTAMECDLLETMLGETKSSVEEGEESGSPMPSLSWSESGENESVGSVEGGTVSPVDVFGGAGSGYIAGISIPSDEEEEAGVEGRRERGGSAPGGLGGSGMGMGMVMEGEEREKYEATTAPIRAYSWKGRMSSSRRSSAGI